MKEPIYDYDPAAALVDPETIALFMADAFETGDAGHIAKALGVVARAKGMTELAKSRGYPANSFTARSATRATLR